MGDSLARLASLRRQHRKLDHDIQNMEARHADALEVQQAKKTKLHIKEQIERLSHAGHCSH